MYFNNVKNQKPEIIQKVAELLMNHDANREQTGQVYGIYHRPDRASFWISFKPGRARSVNYKEAYEMGEKLLKEVKL